MIKRSAGTKKSVQERLIFKAKLSSHVFIKHHETGSEIKIARPTNFKKPFVMSNQRLPKLAPSTFPTLTPFSLVLVIKEAKPNKPKHATIKTDVSLSWLQPFAQGLWRQTPKDLGCQPIS